MSKSMMLAKVGTKMTRFVSGAKFVAKAKSPEILLGVGIAGFVGTVALACRATLKSNDILDEYEKKVADAKEALDAPEVVGVEPYTEEDFTKHMKVLKATTALKFVRLYGPSVALGAFSVACILTSRNILNKRYLGAVSAYNAVSEAFQQYRSRVVDEYGDKMDKHFRYGTTYSTVTEKDKDENGKVVKKKVDIEETPSNDTAVYFDETNPNWCDNANFNLIFLRGQQNRANDILHARGHIFLNDVRRMLGLKDTPEGAIIGWRMINGDEYVDFGLYDLEKENVRRFVNGKENVVLLNFNHQGIIYNKI